MTGEKVKEAVAVLVGLLGSQEFVHLGLQPVRYDVQERTLGQTRPMLKHLLYMADEIPRFVDDGRLEKAMRWLGFMQGVLWSLGSYSLDELMRMNMPDEPKSPSP